MGSFFNRLFNIGDYFREMACSGLPEAVGPFDDEVLFILDGVGGFQMAPLLIRKALRDQGCAMGTVYYPWQFGLPGEIWTDLMWLKRNRVMGAKLARLLLAFRRRNPSARIHIAAFSGGAGIAVFALETLRARSLIETLAMACPALSPEYDLSHALTNVKRAYALVSRKDTKVLGLGTRIFGTTDRRFTPAAGCLGFRIPVGANEATLSAYDRLREIHWTPELKVLGHHGGHTGWVTPGFLRPHFCFPCCTDHRCFPCTPSALPPPDKFAYAPALKSNS